MKRKVTKVGTMKLSPNEEAMLLKQERERRRKLRLQQVREQEKCIAQQIRQDVKERRELQLQQLAEELQAQWQDTQAKKLRALEKVYLSSLSTIGEGHRQAKENEPDLQAIQRQVAVNKDKAEKRHREALQELKQHREQHLQAQTWHIKARKKALNIEKERAAKIASLPPPPPDPLENIEVVKSLPTVRVCRVDNFSVSHYHLPEPYVDREMETEQPDAREAAEEEAKRLDELQKEEERERLEQTEKANLRGNHALKMVHLSQDRDKLLKELEQMQQDDLARRRQIVAQMPQQLFEPGYRRAEIKEDWQRELEAAFEDMYTGDRQMGGDMILHLKPQPLPVPSAGSVDEDLDLSMEPDHASEMLPRIRSPEREGDLDKPCDNEVKEAKEPQSRIVLKRLLHKIRTQQDQWSAKSDTETVSDTVESGSLPCEEIKLDAKPNAEHVEENRSVAPDPQDLTDNTVLAGNSILFHPEEQATRIRTAVARQQKMEDLERQKQEQLELLKKLEEERKRLEAEYLKVQLEIKESKKPETESPMDTSLQKEKEEPVVDQPANPAEVTAPISVMNSSVDSPHIRMIREYQQRLLQQNRQHKQSVEDARNRLQEYQLLLKKRYGNISSPRLESAAEIQNCSTLKPSLETRTSENFMPTTILPYGNTNASNSNIRSILKEKLFGGNVELPKTTTGPPRSTLVSFPGQMFLPSAELSTSLSQATQQQGAQEQAVLLPLLSKDISKIENTFLKQPNLIEKMRSPVMIDKPFNSTAPVSKKGFTDEPRAQIETRYQNPEQSMVGSYSVLTSPETQSSTFTQDSETDSYHPLPALLSLGQPHIESVVVSEPSGPQAVHANKKLSLSFGEFSNVHEFQERLLSSTTQIQAQQDQLREMQLQLDKQRESLLSKQKTHEEQLLFKQKELEEQMRRHQGSLEQFFSNNESNWRTLPADVSQISKNERFQLMSTLLKALENGDQEEIGLGNGSGLRIPGREQRLRSSKPPVTKTKLGSMLEQHELSAIQEVDTPTTSGRPSSTGLKQPKQSSPGFEDRGGTYYDPEKSRTSGSSGYSVKEMDLSRVSSNSRDQSANDSSSSHKGWSSKLSWREMLSVEVGSASLNTDGLLHSSEGPGLSSKLAEVFFIPPTTQERSGWLVKGSHVSPKAHLEALNDYLSTTTLSTGSFLTSEKTDSSPNYSESSSDLQKCNFSIIREAADRNTVAADTSPFLHQMKLSRAWSPESVMYAEDHRSQIQQIIHKYTRNLRPSLEKSLSFHAPTASVDISATEDCHSPTAFHALEPKPDFNFSAQSYAQTGNSQENRNFSQDSSDFSSQEWTSQRNHVFSLQDSNSLRSFVDLNNSQNMELATGSFVQENQTADSSSFHPLHPESTLNEPIMSSMDHESPKSSVCGFDSKTREPMQTNLPQLPGNSYESEENVSFPPTQSFAEILRAESQTLHEGNGSFNELMATPETTNETSLSEHPVTELLELRNEDTQYFAELPVVNTKHHQAEDSATILDDSHNNKEPEGTLLKEQSSHSITITGLEISNQTLKSEASTIESSGNRNSLTGLTISSSASSFGCCLPIWDTESARGIMEEPELTLVSFNDSNVTGLGSEAPPTPTSTSDHHAEPSTVENSFHPLPAEVDTSNFLASCCAPPDPTDMSSSQQFTGMDLEFTCSVGDLQEAFLKKKRQFIKKSAERVEEIKQKDRVAKAIDFKSAENVESNTEMHQSLCPAGTNPTDISQFKKVLEVKVCTPEDRKLSEIEMRQRTVRLYNQLDEVKIRQEEKKRQESYARNRDKAKEFKKKTLERLRARNMK
ncbi:centrosomal protein of 295 kDa [Discoglossus pictus]